MRGEVLKGLERRRRWSVEQKLEVVRASLEPGAIVSVVARRFDVTRQQVYDWRRAARRGELAECGPVLAFIEVAPTPGLETESPPSAPAVTAGPLVAPSAEPAAADVTVEIGMAGGRCLRVPSALSTVALRRLIRAVEGA